jgi:hypothetical protein
MALDGQFVVVWNSAAQDGDAGGVFAKLFPEFP